MSVTTPAAETAPVLCIGEWRLDADRHALLRLGQDDEPRVIGAQNMALLLQFAAHPGELLSREQLLDAVWRGVVVNDNTLSKAVADLRQQLGDDAREARYIATVPRRGYRLIAEVRRLEGATAAQTLPVAESPTNDHAPASMPVPKRRMLALGVAASLFVLLSVLTAAYVLWPTGNETRAGDFTRLTPFTSEPGLELSPHFSPDGQRIVYVRYPDMQSRGQLIVQSLQGAQTVLPLPADLPADAVLESPAWSPDGRQIAYVSRRGADCDVRVMSLAAQGTAEIVSDLKIAACALVNHRSFSTLRWSPVDQQLYYTAREQGRIVLMAHDLQSGQRNFVEGVQAPWSFALHPRDARIAYNNLQTMQSNLHVLDRATGRSELLQQRQEIHLGLDWDPLGRGVLVTSALVGGRVEYLSLKGARHLLLPSADPFFSPAFSPDGRRLAVAQLRFNYDLWQKDLSADGAANAAGKPLIRGGRWDYAPRFSHAGTRLAFISTRSGEPAVHFADAKGENIQVPFRLPENVWPVFLRWSPDDRYLWIGTSALQIWRFDLVTQQLKNVFPKDMAVLNPSPSADGKKLFFSWRQAGRWQIGRLQIDKLEWSTQLDAQGQPLAGMMAQATPDGSALYVMHDGDPELQGLWRYEQQDGLSGHATRVAKNIEPRGWQSLEVRDQAVWFVGSARGVLGVWKAENTQPPRMISAVAREDSVGPMQVDFALSPDEQRLLFTQFGEMQSDLVLLEK